MTNAVRTTKQSMTIRLARLAAGAAVSVAFITTATPAMAQLLPEPRGGSIEQSPDRPTAPTPPASAVDVSSATLGALGGIALGGIGLGITLGVQRRRDRSAAHPV
ncbi:hypothetical protein AB0L70_09990 [Kribbella sp. NPDC051952]|uniref:hypothetical protein n=1 Tax=Kribbella sp. NPDC051952 TaxID=3154851 RepID=UPI003432FF08